MEEHYPLLERAARFTAFATLGALSASQDVARTALTCIEGTDPELVAEETLALVAVATARAAEVGLREETSVAAAVVPALLHLPFSYRDYLVGGALIAQQDPALVDASNEIYTRLERKRDFYAIHLPPDQFPGELALNDKMALWMGRISPPGLPDSPVERLARLDLASILLIHLRLVLAYGKRGPAGSKSS